MARKRVAIAMMALWLLVQMGIASGARAEAPHLGADIAAGAISALATAFAFPVRVAACAAALAWSGHSSPLNPLGQLMNTTLRLIVLSVALCMALAGQAAGEELTKSTPGQKALRGATNLSLGLVLG